MFQKTFHHVLQQAASAYDRPGGPASKDIEFRKAHSNANCTFSLRLIFPRDMRAKPGVQVAILEASFTETPSLQFPPPRSRSSIVRHFARTNQMAFAAGLGDTRQIHILASSWLNYAMGFPIKMLCCSAVARSARDMYHRMSGEAWG